ncbi:hypothetical protein SK128_017405 [Halocaridina rubra]|uniref:Uncharacterized protein n=1 Tax=Halocaridina rubra TaxID=373956 RepID=A0AAN9AGZ1_HALRR
MIGLASFYMFFPGAWLLTAGIYLFAASLKVSVTGKAVFITGCDSGFGHGLALRLHSMVCDSCKDLLIKNVSVQSVYLIRN